MLDVDNHKDPSFKWSSLTYAYISESQITTQTKKNLDKIGIVLQAGVVVGTNEPEPSINEARGRANCEVTTHCGWRRRVDWRGDPCGMQASKAISTRGSGRGEIGIDGREGNSFIGQKPIFSAQRALLWTRHMQGELKMISCCIASRILYSERFDSWIPCSLVALS